MLDNRRDGVEDSFITDDAENAQLKYLCLLGSRHFHFGRNIEAQCR